MTFVLIPDWVNLFIGAIANEMALLVILSQVLARSSLVTFCIQTLKRFLILLIKRPSV